MTYEKQGTAHDPHATGYELQGRDRPELSRLLAEATKRPMTPAQEREQRISFVHGNVGMSNPSVTRAMVERAVDGQTDIAARITTDITDAYAQHARFDNPAPEREQFDAANDNSTECTRTGAGPGEASVYAEPHKPAIYAQADRRGPYVGTYTGRFYMLDPRPGDFTTEDVAHALANICRYTGACWTRYSVAEHSVLITRWIRANGGTQEEQLCALLHDGPEALSGFGDVARPAKNLAPIIRETEESIWRLAIAPKYGLPLTLPAIVHEADNRIIADEMAQNMREVDPAYTEPLGVTLEFWNPAMAEAAFLNEYWRLIETGRM